MAAKELLALPSQAKLHAFSNKLLYLIVDNAASAEQDDVRSGKFDAGFGLVGPCGG